MMKLVTILSLLSMSPMAFAQSMVCKIDVNIVDKAGYLIPISQKLVVKTQVAKNDSMSASLAQNQCTTTVYQKLSLKLCANEADFIGGYDVSLIKPEKVIEDSQLVSVRKFGTLKSNQGLTAVYGLDKILKSFLEKTRKAGIESPSEFNGDSLFIDEAVEQGVAKGVLTHGEPVIVKIDDCQLSD